MSVSARITNISRGSLHDGPGVRTVVYLKGCGMRCRWCHNPETFENKREILYAPVKCIHCGRCVRLCPEHHVIEGNEMRLLRDGCTLCGKCAMNCPSGALSLCGEEKTAEEVFSIVAKDKHFYTQSGGGITVSGGECLLQSDFVAELFQLCRAAQIHTAIETALYVPREALDKVIPLLDFAFCDLKLPSFEKYREWTAADAEVILSNMHYLTENHPHVVVRIPMIPGVNTSEDDLRGFAKIIRTLGNGLREVEMLRYNPLGASKYEQSGRSFTGFAENAQGDSEMLAMQRILQEALQNRCPVTFV